MYVQAPSWQANFEGHIASLSAMPSQSLSLPSQISALGPTQPSQASPPLRHTVLPPLHWPTPTWACVSFGHRQSAPTPGRTPLSMMPSQSSSRPLQVSVLGMLTVLQTSWPLTQAKMPAEQVPMPLPQASPTPGKTPLSTLPSQSSSMLLQLSTPGGTTGASQKVPLPSALHARMPPRLQAPTPVLTHEAPTMKPSSMLPSQLLSRPSHFSVGTAQPQGPPQALGGKPSSTVPLQLSSLQLQDSMAQWAAAAPLRLSASFGSFERAHMLLTPSSIWPLQLSSLPLQVSEGFTVFAMMPTSAALTAAVSVSVTRIAEVVPPALAMSSFATLVLTSVSTYVSTFEVTLSWQAWSSGWKAA